MLKTAEDKEESVSASATKKDGASSPVKSPEKSLPPPPPPSETSAAERSGRNLKLTSKRVDVVGGVRGRPHDNNEIGSADSDKKEEEEEGDSSKGARFSSVEEEQRAVIEACRFSPSSLCQLVRKKCPK